MTHTQKHSSSRISRRCKTSDGNSAINMPTNTRNLIDTEIGFLPITVLMGYAFGTPKVTKCQDATPTSIETVPSLLYLMFFFLHQDCDPAYQVSFVVLLISLLFMCLSYDKCSWAHPLHSKKIIWLVYVFVCNIIIFIMSYFSLLWLDIWVYSFLKCYREANNLKTIFMVNFELWLTWRSKLDLHPFCK